MNYLKLMNELQQCFKSKCEDKEDLKLCVYQNCQVQKKIYKLRIKIIKDRIKLYKIKFSPNVEKKYKLLIEFKLNDNNFLQFEELLIFIENYINKQINIKIKKFIKLFQDYINCANDKCKDLTYDVLKIEKLKKDKVSVFNIKNDKKRNEVIKNTYSNENQVKLDKCVTNKCNKISLDYINEAIKQFNNKIKTFNLKIPIVPKLTKLSEDDIPEIIIKINQVARYIDKHIGYL